MLIYFHVMNVPKLLFNQSGIKEVYYLEDKYANTNGVIASKRLFDACGVKYKCLKKEKDV